MKKINLLNMIFMLFIVSCRLKQFTVNNNIKVKMPSNAAVVPVSQLTGNSEPLKTFDKVYTYDGVLVGLTQSKNESFQGVPFDELKKTEAYNWQKAGTVQSAQIETYGDKRFLILNIDVHSTGVEFSEYMFISDTEIKKPIFLGTVQYDKATQQNKAKGLLKTILTNTEN